jgi:hypothetical protein
MPLPAFAAPALGPWVWKAAAGGAAAIALWQAARHARRPRARAEVVEAALDSTPEGLELGLSRDGRRARGDAGAAWRGVIRLGHRGPGVAVDFAALARLRVAPAPAVRAGRAAAR